MNDADLAALLPPIPHDANKYTRGSLLILAGSKRFPGAAILAAQAAARTGAGYVSLGIPEPAAPVAQAHLLSIPVIALPAADGAFSEEAWAQVLAHVRHIDAIILGPGLTVTTSVRAFVETVLQEASAPLLLDADALNCLTSSAVHHAAPLILTPHAGELKRLFVTTGASSTQELATNLNAVVVAKGPKTHIVSPTRSYTSTAGTPALAKAGTGDVLAGMIGALLSQGLSPYDAAVLGVELHGRAGRFAEQSLGRRSVCAEDVIAAIPAILKELEA